MPGQPCSSCCGRSRWGNQYPRLRSTFLCHGSAAKDRALFPSSPPLLPLHWPQTQPLLTARSPRSSPGLSHSSGTQHPTDKGAIKTPTNIATNHDSGKKEKKERDHKAACNAMGWVMVAKPLLQQTAMQHKQPSPAPCRGCRVNIVNPSGDRIPW